MDYTESSRYNTTPYPLPEGGYTVFCRPALETSSRWWKEIDHEDS